MPYCEDAGGTTRYFYTGNQVGHYNHTGEMNYVSGGPPGSGIAAGAIVPVFFPDPTSRSPWKNADAQLTQNLLDASFPFIELNWIADIVLDADTTFRISDRNVYVEEEDGPPRFYEARVARAPNVSVTLGEWLNPNFQVGDLKLQLNNRDGIYNQYLPGGANYSQWIGAEIIIRVGFGEQFSNYFEIFRGHVTPKQGIESTETDLLLKCYDRFEKDNIKVPALVYSALTYPKAEEDAEGKAVALVYGDWSTEVGDYGQIRAYCTNAKESSPTEYLFKISQNALQSIGDVYLHRGNRTLENPEGPVKFLSGSITVEADKGHVIIPTETAVLAEVVDVMKSKAGATSGLNFITSESGEVNFIDKGVQVGDTVIKVSTSQQSTVTTVANFQLNLSGGITYAQDDEFLIQSNQYLYRKSDKVSVVCVGKNVQTMAVNRLSDAGLGSSTPIGLSVDLERTYWFADDVEQKIYRVSFEDEIKKTIAYSDIDASITEVSGLSVQTDGTLWLFDKPTSTIYRYILEDDSTGLSFATTTVSGLAASLTDGRGLTVDEANFLYIVDNSSGTYYKIDPFTPFQPTLLASWNRTAFDASATDTLDLSADVNQGNLTVVDRNTNKFYRIDNTTGALVVGSDFDLADISDTIDFGVGVASAQDGTIFVLNRSDLSLYNYNEDTDASYNPGFIARDLLQSLVGKTSGDFDLFWNQACTEDLSQFRGRLYIDKRSDLMTVLHKFLQQFNTAMYAKFGLLALFHITFDNFTADGDIIREGDIVENSFKPKKEYNQYFNSVSTEYKEQPFESSSITSDTYISVSGLSFAGNEILKELKSPSVYRRADIDQLMPLMVRLAAAEPEFIDVQLGFRLLFIQLMDFYRMNFDSLINCTTGQKTGGRRFDNVPVFVRQINYNLSNMTFKAKLWSLGTTEFGTYDPPGDTPGGEYDKIVLTTLGTYGYISPIGTITASGADSVTLEDVDGDDAETRSASIVGNAWASGHKVELVNAATMAVEKVLEIDSVSGQVVTFTENIGITVNNSTENLAGFITSGHFLRHATYDESTQAQTEVYAHYGRPEVGYPTTTAEEISAQESGAHNFEDDRKPYLLHPSAYSPS